MDNPAELVLRLSDLGSMSMERCFQNEQELCQNDADKTFKTESLAVAQDTV
jgi:hypothetical protein